VVVAGAAGEVVGPAVARGGTSAGAVAVAGVVVAVEEEGEVPARAAARSVGWRREVASAERAVAGSSGRAG